MGRSVLRNIDVTLRDGGYRNGFDFPIEYARKHAGESAASGLEWIEIGYRNGSFKPMANLGMTGRGDDHYIREIADVIDPDRICMILHPKNITDADLTAMYAAGVRLVRVCLPNTDPEAAYHVVRQAKQIGFTVSMNITRVSRLAPRRLVELVTGSADAGSDVVCLADSNGSLMPEDTARLVTLVRSVCDAEIGLHAHNNLGLALPNAIAAITAGATWIDSSIMGMGKGPGNLITEQWLAYLRRSGRGHDYDLGRLLALADTLEREIAESKPALPQPDLVLGCFDLSVEDRVKLPESGSGQVFAAARELAGRNAAK